MGRTLKRVPLDFNWPLRKTWSGFIMPDELDGIPCASCDESGYSPVAKLYSDQWYGYAAFDPVEYSAKPLELEHPDVQAFARRNVEGSPEYYRLRPMPDPSRGEWALKHWERRKEEAIAKEAYRLWDMWRSKWSYHLIQADIDALIEDERLWDFTRVPRTPEQEEIVRRKVATGENSWLPTSNGYRPTPDEVNSWNIRTRGHDGINQSVCVRARCKREGVDPLCSVCNGEGVTWASEEHKQKHDAWEPTEPPKGDGYQLWQTTSEGSPISPVFDTLEALCAYAAEHCSTFGDNTATAEQWKEMLDDGFVHHREGNTIFL